jgi:hypothetical protein
VLCYYGNATLFFIYQTAVSIAVSLFSAVLLWKCHKLTVMQQALSRYYGNATGCTDHVTKENLICHNMLSGYDMLAVTKHDINLGHCIHLQDTSILAKKIEMHGLDRQGNDRLSTILTA